MRRRPCEGASHSFSPLRESLSGWQSCQRPPRPSTTATHRQTPISPINIRGGQHRLWLVNAPSGTYPNKFVLTSKNLTTGAVATQKVLDPPYDWGNAFTLVTSTDSCNEMTMQTGDSYRFSGYNNQWIRI